MLILKTVPNSDIFTFDICLIQIVQVDIVKIPVVYVIVYSSKLWYWVFTRLYRFFGDALVYGVWLFLRICCLKPLWNNKHVTNSLFVYFPDLTQHIVKDNEQIQKLIDQGNENRYQETVKRVYAQSTFSICNVCAAFPYHWALLGHEKADLVFLTFVG